MHKLYIWYVSRKFQLRWQILMAGWLVTWLFEDRWTIILFYGEDLLKSAYESLNHTVITSPTKPANLTKSNKLRITDNVDSVSIWELQMLIFCFKILNYHNSILCSVIKDSIADSFFLHFLMQLKSFNDYVLFGTLSVLYLL